jgi:hypothetical protein
MLLTVACAKVTLAPVLFVKVTGWVEEAVPKMSCAGLTATPLSVLNVALALIGALIVNGQVDPLGVPAPEHAPPQPANVETPPAAVAVSVTEVPSANVAEHVPGQLMPAGELVIVPLVLVPARVTVS